jgi:hypothetical protein
MARGARRPGYLSLPKPVAPCASQGILQSESEGMNPAVSSYIETIPGGDQGLEMTKAHHGGTRTRW